MNARLFSVAVALVGLSLTACQSGDGGVPNHMRDFGSTLGGFSGKKNALKASSMNANDLGAILKCDDPSTAERLDKKEFAHSVQKTTRSQYGLNSPVIVITNRSGYSTTNKGQTSTISSETSEYSIGGISALPRGPIAFKQDCAGNDCGSDEDRVFTQNDLMYMLGLQQRVDKAASEAMSKMNTSQNYLSCSFEEDLDAEKVEDTFQEGTYTVNGTSHTAVQYTSLINGKIRCNGSTVGKGQIVKRTIVIADMLPGTESVFDVGGKRIGDNCTRTKVYSGSKTTWGTRVIDANDEEISGYSLNGDVPSVEEYKKNQEDYDTMVANLEDAVRIARNRYNDTKASYADAKAKTADKKGDYEEAEADVTNKKNELDKIQQSENPDPVLVQAAKNAYRDAQIRRDSARRVYELAVDAERKARDSVDAAELALGQAQRELEDYKANNKPKQG